MEGITVPDEENDLRKQQLRELALLNGTLRENDSLSKLKQFQEAQTIITNTILCIICGGAGHIAADCKQRRPGETLQNAIANSAANAPAPNFSKAAMDTEYMSLMAELGQGPAPSPDQLMNRSHSTPALPMLGHSRPMLALNAPPAISPASDVGSQQQQQLSRFSSRPPLHLPTPRMPGGCPPPWSSGTSSQLGFSSSHCSSPRNSSAPVRPLMSLNPVPPPSLQNKGAPPPPPWQHNNRSPAPAVSQAPAMMPPPPPPPFCSQPVPPPGSLPPWQQPMSGLRPFPPPPPMNVPWGPPILPMGMSGVPPPPPFGNFNSWQQPTSSSTATVSMTTNSVTLPAGLTLPPPPPPPN